MVTDKLLIICIFVICSLSPDEIFMPREDLDNGEIDEYEREIEEFKRYVKKLLTLIQKQLNISGAEVILYTSVLKMV